MCTSLPFYFIMDPTFRTMLSRNILTLTKSVLRFKRKYLFWGALSPNHWFKKSVCVCVCVCWCVEDKLERKNCWTNFVQIYTKRCLASTASTILTNIVYKIAGYFLLENPAARILKRFFKEGKKHFSWHSFCDHLSKTGFGGRCWSLISKSGFKVQTWYCKVFNIRLMEIRLGFEAG